MAFGAVEIMRFFVFQEG